MYKLFITQEQLNYILRQWIIKHREAKNKQPGKQEFHEAIIMKEYERYRIIKRGWINKDQEEKLNKIGLEETREIFGIHKGDRKTQK